MSLSCYITENCLIKCTRQCRNTLSYITLPHYILVTLHYWISCIFVIFFLHYMFMWHCLIILHYMWHCLIFLHVFVTLSDCITITFNVHIIVILYYSSPHIVFLHNIRHCFITFRHTWISFLHHTCRCLITLYIHTKWFYYIATKCYITLLHYILHIYSEF